MIGYYVHHHGSGHLRRASCIARAADEPVVALSSLPEPTAPHPFAGWVRLPPDPPSAEAMEPTAGDALHWAPLDSPHYRARMQAISAWLAAAQPRLVVVDLSVEVAAAVRLLGVPVVLVTLPGDRSDPAHTFGYRIASAILAPWPRDVYEPDHLRPFAAKTVYTGAFSRFDAATDDGPGCDRRVLLLFGAGGDAADPDLPRHLRDATGWTCDAIGGRRPWRADVRSAIRDAQVVIAHAGTNAVAEVAALRRPCVLVPQARPFDEQLHTAGALHRAGVARCLPAWPATADWPGVLDDAREQGGAGWARWNDRGGARRAAALLRTVAAS